MYPFSALFRGDVSNALDVFFEYGFLADDNIKFTLVDISNFVEDTSLTSFPFSGGSYGMYM